MHLFGVTTRKVDTWMYRAVAVSFWCSAYCTVCTSKWAACNDVISAGLDIKPERRMLWPEVRSRLQTVMCGILEGVNIAALERDLFGPGDKIRSPISGSRGSAGPRDVGLELLKSTPQVTPKVAALAQQLLQYRVRASFKLSDACRQKPPLSFCLSLSWRTPQIRPPVKMSTSNPNDICASSG